MRECRLPKKTNTYEIQLAYLPKLNIITNYVRLIIFKAILIRLLTMLSLNDFVLFCLFSVHKPCD